MRSPLQQQKAVDKWNSQHPIGTMVEIVTPAGTVRSKTTSEAYIDRHAGPVVDIKQGVEALKRVRAVK